LISQIETSSSAMDDIIMISDYTIDGI